MSRKRDTYTPDPVTPYYLQDAAKETAKLLISVSRGYLQGKATRHDVDEAIRLWNESAPPRKVEP